MRADDPNELVFQFLTLSVSAKGIVALVVGVSVALLIAAIACAHPCAGKTACYETLAG